MGLRTPPPLRATPASAPSRAALTTTTGSTPTSPCSACRSTRPRAIAPARASGPPPSAKQSQLLRPWHPALAVDVFETLSVIDGGDLAITPGNAERTAAQIADGLAPVVGYRRHRARARRRPLDRPRRAARARRAPRPARRRPARRPRRHLGQLLRRALLPRHAVPARAGGRADRARAVAAGRHARAAVRGVRPRRAARVGVRDRALRRAARLAGRRSTGGACASGWRAGRPSCRSTSTCSTPPSRRARARPRSAGLLPHEALAFLRSLAGVEFVGYDVVEVSPQFDGPGQVTAVNAAAIGVRAARAQRGGQDEGEGMREPGQAPPITEVELHGIETIPPEDRTAKPLDLFRADLRRREHVRHRGARRLPDPHLRALVLAGLPGRGPRRRDRRADPDADGAVRPRQRDQQRGLQRRALRRPSAASSAPSCRC